jgi:hypothetical protein
VKSDGRSSYVVAPILAAVLVVVAISAIVVHDSPAHLTGSATAAAHPVPHVSAPPVPHVSAPPVPHVAAPRTSETHSATPAATAIQAVNALHVSGVRYGVGVLDRTTGHETLGTNGTAPFYAASVIKLFVVTYLLHEREEGDITLDDATLDDVARALEQSDDDAMNSMWADFGGLSLIKNCIALFGLRNTTPPTDPSQWGETTVSARDVITVYQYVLTRLSAKDRRVVTGDLAMATDTAADGFDQAFGLLERPRAESVRAKQGWMQITHLGEMTVNTTGLLGADNRYVVVVLTDQPYDIGYPAGKANVTRASDLIVHALNLEPH